MWFAVTAHREGGAAVQELKHTLAVNAMRFSRGEEPYWILAVDGDMKTALETLRILQHKRREHSEKVLAEKEGDPAGAVAEHEG